jgi:hypothetical protein
MRDFNPYAAPRTLHGPVSTAVMLPSGPRPRALQLVLGLLGFDLLVSAAAAVSAPYLGAAGAAFLVLLASVLLRRSALVWRTLIVLDLSVGILYALALWQLAGDRFGATGAVLGIGAIATKVVVPVLLAQESVRAYFGLRCPHCGRADPSADDLLFRRRRCRRCHLTWHINRA